MISLSSTKSLPPSIAKKYAKTPTIAASGHHHREDLLECKVDRRDPLGRFDHLIILILPLLSYATRLYADCEDVGLDHRDAKGRRRDELPRIIPAVD